MESSDRAKTSEKNNDKDSIFGHLFWWLCLINDTHKDYKKLGKLRCPIVLLSSFFILLIIFLTLYWGLWVRFSLLSITAIIFAVVYFIKGKRNWLSWSLPLISVILGAALFCRSSTWLELGSISSWHPEYSSNITNLVSSHFNVMALLTAFVASVSIWYKGDIWKNKGEIIKENLNIMVLKKGHNYTEIQESTDDDIKNYYVIDPPSDYNIDKTPSTLDTKKNSETKELIEVIQNLIYAIEEKKILPKQNSITNNVSIPNDPYTGDIEFASFLDRAKKEFDSLESMIKSLNTLFISNGLVIAILCISSTIFSYQSEFSENITAYHYSYILGFCAVFNSLFHLGIVFYPQFLICRIKSSIKQSNIAKRYEAYIDKNVDIIEEAEGLDHANFAKDL